MPFCRESTSADLFTTYRNVKFFSVYEDDDYDESALLCRFSLESYSGEIDCVPQNKVVDLYEMADWVGEFYNKQTTYEMVMDILRKLVDAGFVTKDGIVKNPEVALDPVDKYTIKMEFED